MCCQLSLTTQHKHKTRPDLVSDQQFYQLTKYQLRLCFCRLRELGDNCSDRRQVARPSDTEKKRRRRRLVQCNGAEPRGGGAVAAATAPIGGGNLTDTRSSAWPAVSLRLCCCCTAQVRRRDGRVRRVCANSLSKFRPIFYLAFMK